MNIRLDSIDTALENELLERSFYLAHSRKTSNPLGKTMFEQLATEEEEHYRRLQEIHEKLANQGAWPETIASNPDSSDIHAAFRSMAARTDTLQEASRDDIEAIKTAIDFETKAHGFYTRLTSQAETEAEKNFFNLLASLEWEHLLTLQDSLLFFESPQDWYAQHEKPQYEG